jgi:hypothetical protein
VATTLLKPAPFSAEARRNPIDAPLLLQFWHLLSLDAPTVAVTWALAFAWATRVTLELWVPILLALITWAVYLADRIIDAYFALRAGRLSCLRERHIFHWRHRRVLSVIAATASAAAACIVFRLMPFRAREHNFVLGVAALAYFCGVYMRRNLPGLFPFSLLRHRSFGNLPINQFSVGLIFAAAVTLPIWTRVLRRAHVDWGPGALGPLAIASVFFVLLGWLNYWAIGRWEAGQKRTRIHALAMLLGQAGLGVACLLVFIDLRLSLLVGTGAISALMLAGLDRGRNRLAPLTLRAAADLVLLMPAALLLFPHCAIC